MEKSEEEKKALFIAKKRLDKIAVRWSVEDRLLLEVWVTLSKIPSPDQKTIGIDSRSLPPVIKYNPHFINSLSFERLECILSQETLKILLKHPTTRLAHPREISSLASSITVAQSSMSSMFASLDMDPYMPTPENYNIVDQNGNALSNAHFEKYFRLLNNKKEEIDQQIEETWNNMSEDEKEKLVGDALEQSEQGEGEDGQEQKREQKRGQGKSNTFKKFEDEKDAMKEHLNPTGTNNKDWGTNDLMDAKIKSLVDKAKGDSKAFGNTTSNFLESIIAANTPKISVKEVTRRFNASAASRKTQPSRMRYNRRYGLKYPGAIRTYTTNILFAVDISGSMSSSELADGFAIINATCKEAKISYMLFDTEIKSVVKDMAKAKETFNITGRGGTDFQEVIDYVNKHKYDGVVIFTDGEAPEPTQPYKTKVLWLMTQPQYNPPVKWGFRAHLKN